MKMVIASLSVFLMAAVAHADLSKEAKSLSLVCKTSKKAKKRFQIVASPTSTTLLVNDEIVYQKDATRAVTEGGPAYMQIMGGGYNITISGGAFDEAFIGSTLVQGDAPALIWSEDTNKNQEATCTGTFEF